MSDPANLSLIRGRYELVERLGRGGQGEVLKARDRIHDRYVALKLYRFGPEQDPRRLPPEARILLSVRHKNLPIVREDFSLEDGTYVIAMEWIDGANMRDILEEEGNPGLPYRRVLRYVEQVADAVEHLHSLTPPVLHGDIKPSNLILTRDEQVVLIDFGISSLQTDDPINRGSWGFVAPEAGTEPLTPAADVYGLAATTAALLQGAVPPAGDPKGLASVPYLRRARYRHAIGRGLALDPQRRPSVGRFVRDLTPWWHRATSPRSTRGRIRLAVATLAVVVALTAMAVSLIAPANDPGEGSVESNVIGPTAVEDIALNPSGNFVYAVREGDQESTLVEIDTATGDERETPVDETARSVSVTETGKVVVLHGLVENQITSDTRLSTLLTVIDPQNWHDQRQIRTKAPTICHNDRGGCENALAVATSEAYVALTQEAAVLVMNLDGDVPERRIRLPFVAERPTDLTLSRDERHLFVCAGPVVAVIDVERETTTHVLRGNPKERCTGITADPQRDRVHVAAQGGGRARSWGAIWTITLNKQIGLTHVSNATETGAARAKPLTSIAVHPLTGSVYASFPGGIWILEPLDGNESRVTTGTFRSESKPLAGLIASRRALYGVTDDRTHVYPMSQVQGTQADAGVLSFNSPREAYQESVTEAPLTETALQTTTGRRISESWPTELVDGCPPLVPIPSPMHGFSPEQQPVQPATRLAFAHGVTFGYEPEATFGVASYGRTHPPHPEAVEITEWADGTRVEIVISDGETRGRQIAHILSAAGTNGCNYRIWTETSELPLGVVLDHLRLAS